MLATAAAAAGLTALPLTGGALPAASAAATRVTDGCISSVPDPGTSERVDICYTLFQPAQATADRKVPLIMHSHGWGGSRNQDPADFQRFLDAGYGVLSYDQRGFGQSGGQAYVENPRVEGHDVRGLIRLVAQQRWVKKDAPGDPRLGAIGGSYGGGYQFLGAFESLRLKGTPVFDALAPEITWNDLNRSLAPEGVVRSEWALALSGAAVPSNSLPPQIYQALIEGAATGEWPDGSVPGGQNLVEFFKRNGPQWHVDHGRRLDIPVLMGQGATDSLFNLQEGLTNWRTALTDRARRSSIFVGYNGGHVLPSAFPAGVEVSGDPCSTKLAGGSFEQLSLRFFDEKLRGRDTGLRGYGRFHLATAGNTCTTVSSVTPDTTKALGTITTPTVASPAQATEIATGPYRVAGSSHLTADVTTLTPNSRAFFGLAIGTSPADAKLVQKNVMPLNEETPVTGERRRIELPAVAVNVPKGQNLYLLTSALSDSFVGFGSRTAGVVTLDDTQVHLPTVG
ncbi:peptidase S15 [Nocardioides sp. HDW12B]|nr:peptidase S15 [Nocardioides sp. HDW12B]